MVNKHHRIFVFQDNKCDSDMDTGDYIKGQNKLLVGTTRAKFADTTLKMDELHIISTIQTKWAYPCSYECIKIYK